MYFVVAQSQNSERMFLTKNNAFSADVDSARAFNDIESAKVAANACDMPTGYTICVEYSSGRPCKGGNCGLNRYTAS